MTAKTTMTRLLVATIILAMLVAFMPVITKDDTYAASKKKKVKVTFNVNGGKALSKAKKTKQVVKGKKIGKLPKTTKKGYTLKGWYTKKTGGKKVTTKTKIKKKTTLYARWDAKEYTVNFDANGGETPTLSNKVYKSKKVKYKGKYGTMPTTKRTGYKLKGWYTAKSGGSNITTTTTNNTAATDTLYAQWSKVEDSEEMHRFKVQSGTVVSSSKPGKLIFQGKEGYYPIEEYEYPGGTIVTIRADESNYEGYGTFHSWSIATMSATSGFGFAPGYDKTTSETKVLVSPYGPTASFGFLITAIYQYD